MSQALDISDTRYGRLLAMERIGTSSDGKAVWLCRCDCGGTTTARTGSLRRGNTTSCGCYQREQHSKRIALRNARSIVTYTGAHTRVERVKGLATCLGCVDCGQPASEWSYSKRDPDEFRDPKGRPYSLNPDFYVPRCRGCHRKFDIRNEAASTEKESAA